MFVDVDRFGPFGLTAAFLDEFRERPVPWGFGTLSWITYTRSYGRNGESWWQTCQRVIEGMYTVQKAHALSRHLPWDEARAQHESQEAYRRLFDFRWTPPGRGLWIMGTRFVYEHGSAALNNCGFVSTSHLDQSYAEPFVWLLGMSMLGVGIGFDTRGAGTVRIQPARRGEDVHCIEDTREGWCVALRRLLDAYSGRGQLPARWDDSKIRPRGSPLQSFGGHAGGPEPLRQMLGDLDRLHSAHAGQTVDARLIVDTMNLIGRCVVAGGIRRSAQIAFGRADDPVFLDLKQDTEALRSHRWVANHSILAEVGMDYDAVARRTARNGEPGYLWLENARTYGRMADPPDPVDLPAQGTNPCAEQTLWDRELCCLVETYPAHHRNLSDYRATLRIAYEYAKTVTLIPTHDTATNTVMLRNRRTGCSMTGVVQAIERHGYRRFLRWCDDGYAYVRSLDAELSARFAVPRSIKCTSIKPSGTVSLLAGATPGLHWDHAPYYIRRVRVSETSPLIELCNDAGYGVEADVYSSGTAVISFPVHVRHLGRSKHDVPLREKVDLAAQLQHYWSDNQVSCTAEFDPEREGNQIPEILRAYEDRLKGIVFLPTRGHGYPQAPYETISREEYESRLADLRPIRGVPEHEPLLESAFCDGDRCEPDPELASRLSQ